MKTRPPASRREPPRLAQRILRRFLPPGKRGASILGDLHEEFHARRSARTAGCWYLLHAIALSSRYAPRTVLVSRRTLAMTHDLRSDLRSAFRLFLRTPTTSAIIVFTLAAAIAAATIGFAFADLALFRGLPVDDGSKVVSVFFSDSEGSNPRARVSAPDFVDLRQRVQSLERVAAFRQASAPLIVNAQPTTLSVCYATADVFFAMGQTAAPVGRVFGPGDDANGAPRVALLSHRYWQETYSGRATAVGSVLQIGRDHFTVIGVVPPQMEFGNIAEIDVWLPLTFSGAEPRDQRNLRFVARLRDGVSFERAAAEIASLGDTLAAEHPDSNGGWRVRLVPVRELTGGPGFWVVVALFLLSVALLIAIATANVSNLVMVRTLARARELAVRTALGARRGRLVRQLIIEGLALSAASAVVALMFAYGGLRVVASMSSEMVFQQLRIDEHELGFVAALTLLCPLCFSVVPARLLSRADTRQTLSDGTRSVTASMRGRGVLVVAQVSLAVILLIASGLALRSVTALYSRPTGIDAARILIFTLDFNDVLYPTQAAARAEALVVRDSLKQIAGVEEAALLDALPILGAESVVGFTLDQQAPAASESRPMVIATGTTDGAASVLGLTLMAGRWWTSSDSGGVVVGRETAVRYLGGIEAAVGRSVSLWRGGNASTVQVIGVVNDVATGDPMDWMPPRVWLPISEDTRRVTFAVRTTRDPSTLTSEVRGVVARATPAVPIERLSTLSAALEVAASSDYVVVQVLAGFALLALVLAATGIFGVLSFSASQRTAEFGTRIALGASTFDVVRLVAGQALVFLACGLGIGLSGGLAVAFSMRGLLFDLSPIDPVTIAGVCAMLAVVTVAATALPAWRAGRVDPVTALRSE
jgi:putative ABC transport system permease protein